MVPELRGKIFKWLKSHSYINNLERDMKVKANSAISCEDEVGRIHESDALAVSESYMPNPVAVKSVPPRRRTKSDNRILKEGKLICSSEEILSDNRTMTDRVKVDQLSSEEANDSSKISVFNATEKVIPSIVFAWNFL